MKVFVITKKHIMLSLVLCLTIILLSLGSAAVIASNDRKLPIYCVETEKKRIAISFDAAWGNTKKVQNIN